MKKFISATLFGTLLVVGQFIPLENVQAAGLEIVSQVLPEATIGEEYTHQLEASGGTAPYTWSYTDTSFPSACCVIGFGPDGLFNTQTSSTVSGPAGTYTWDVTVTDAEGSTANATLYLTIKQQGDSTCYIMYFNAVPEVVGANQTSSLEWGTQGCESVGLYSTNSSGNIFSTKLKSGTSGKYTTQSSSSPGTYYYRLAGTSSDSVDPMINETYQTRSVTVQIASPSPAPPLGAPYYGNPPKNVVHNGTVYLVDGNYRQPYTSAAAFLSYSFNSWANVTPATASDLALPLATYSPNGTTATQTLFVSPRDGSLINDNGTVYVIVNGTRQGFSSAQVFKDFGFSFSNVISGDTSFMVTIAPLNNSVQSHPNGSVVNYDGTLYFLSGSGSRYGIPSMEIFNSWGLKLSEVVSANFHDKLVPVGGTMQLRLTNQFGI